MRKIGIDLGTANTIVYVPKKGIVLNEPTVVAAIDGKKEVLAIGNEAKEMLGRTPDDVIALRPMKEGVIADYRITEQMLSYFIRKAGGRIRIFRPEVMVSVPAGITSTERRAVVDATMQSGAKAAHVVREPVLAAIGAGIPINTPSGNMIVNIGGGTAEIAVISLGGVVSWASVRVGGIKIDESITSYIKNKFGLAIGEKTSEDIKIKLGSATVVEDEKAFEIRGRDLISGLPKTIELTTNMMVDAISEPMREIVHAIRMVFQETPPDLSADVMDKGIVLSGGTAQLKNIDVLITQKTGVNCIVADDPLLCVAKGTGIALENLALYKRAIQNK